MKTAFPPIIDRNAKLLILGSMPGEKSLQLQQYYGFGANAFWKIMETLFGIPATTPYLSRVNALQESGIAVWDVLAGCERQGSLDSNIVKESIVVNDFGEFLRSYPNIGHIFLNGKSVEQLFKRYVLSSQTLPAEITITVLPSTSPANARLTFENKLEQWSAIKEVSGSSRRPG